MPLASGQLIDRASSLKLLPFYLLPLGLGLLIDAGVSYPGLIVTLGLYCMAISALMLRVTRRLKARALAS